VVDEKTGGKRIVKKAEVGGGGERAAARCSNFE